MRIQSLERQLELLDALESRHVAWAGDMDDHQIKKMHFEIIELIQQTKDKYSDMLGAYYRRMK